MPTLLAGGYEYDGRSELAPLDEGQLRGIARQVLAAGISCIVVSGVFSPVRAAQEERAAAILRQEAQAVLAEAAAVAAASDAQPAEKAVEVAAAAAARQLFICRSGEVGQLGLLERENAAILNAALAPLARRVVPACQAALAAAGIQAPLFFTSNDGTLLSAEAALALPVATFQSGPVNSLRGAAALTGLQQAAAVDIGGTTTDVGMLVGGLPRPAPRAVRCAGAATNFQMPDVISIGLGGGSRVRFPAAAGPAAASQAAHGGCTVGPDSVGARLAEEALCMGGATCTASDVAVLLGRMQLGSRQAAASGLTAEQAEQAWAAVQQRLEGCLDHVKTQAGGVC